MLKLWIQNELLTVFVYLAGVRLCNNYHLGEIWSNLNFLSKKHKTLKIVSGAIIQLSLSNNWPMGNFIWMDMKVYQVYGYLGSRSKYNETTPLSGGGRNTNKSLKFWMKSDWYDNVLPTWLFVQLFINMCYTHSVYVIKA